MKIKYKEEIDTYTLKDVTPIQLEIIHSLMQHYRLGGEGEYADDAYELVETLKEHSIDIMPIKFTYTEDEGFSIEI